MTNVDETHIPVFESPLEEHEANTGSVGSVIAILLIVTLLVIGAFYVWGQRVSEQRASEYVHAVQ